MSYNRIKFLLFFHMLIALVSSCNKEDRFGIKEISDYNLVATGYAENIDMFEAQLLGSFNLSLVVSQKYTVGIIYGEKEELSLDSEGAIKEPAHNIIGNTFSISVSNLKPSTTYYYRAFLSMNGADYYGMIKQFSTKNLTLDMYIGEWEGDTLEYGDLLNGGYGSGYGVDYDTRHFPATISIYGTSSALNVKVPVFNLGTKDNYYNDYEYKTLPTAYWDNGTICCYIGPSEGFTSMWVIYYSSYNTITLSQGEIRDGSYYLCSFKAHKTGPTSY